MAQSTKEPTHPMASLAGKVLAKGGRCTAAEAMALAGCVIGTFERTPAPVKKRG